VSQVSPHGSVPAVVGLGGPPCLRILYPGGNRPEG